MTGATHHCLRKEVAQPAPARRPTPRPAQDEGEGRVLACAVCRQKITTTAARISVGGAHEHSFANPHGFRFHIGCFARVVGCVPVGEPSSYWSWFPAYTWQIEDCGSCAGHLGWLFRTDDHRFHGLILDRLVEVEESE